MAITFFFYYFLNEIFYKFFANNKSNIKARLWIYGFIKSSYDFQGNWLGKVIKSFVSKSIGWNN